MIIIPILFMATIFVVAPTGLGLLVTAGSWRHATRGLLVWYGLLLLLFAPAALFNFDDAVYGFTLMGMFISMIAVPLFSFLSKFWTGLKTKPSA